ncbi:MAG: protoheme IX farnesyltransferase [Phycisphaerae bacterium]|nr:protoheme IX farnesyltransferase [Phycisphaerae bacterium]
MPEPATTTAPAAALADSLVRRPSHAAVWSTLVKARLSALVLMTAAVGFAVAPYNPMEGFPWERFFWTCFGTGLAAASAAMLNQLWEVQRDARMKRTSGRPLPAGHARPITVFVVGVALAYGSFALLAGTVNLLAAALALGNILIYVLLYTPLKPRTTFNTLVGAVTGAVPPLIGWAGAVGRIDAGAWALFAILFVWQLPHFLALAWMYREDYERGGFAMLPSHDRGGHTTAQVCLLTSLLLVPVGLLGTLSGVAGYAYAAVAVVLGLAMGVQSWRFVADRSHARARRLFLSSLLYLPVLLIVMVLDRGSVVPVARASDKGTIIEMPAGRGQP